MNRCVLTVRVQANILRTPHFILYIALSNWRGQSTPYQKAYYDGQLLLSDLAEDGVVNSALSEFVSKASEAAEFKLGSVLLSRERASRYGWVQPGGE